MTPNECAELFAKTMEELNAVSQLQMRGILNVIVTGLEAAKSPISDKGDIVQKLSELVEELKNASTGVGKIAVEPMTPTDQNSDKFCEAVEDNINIAMKNALNNQQQLNVMGAAALAQVIELLI